MKISIVTVCYNTEKTIEKAILSVLNQTYKNIEYIIIDGKSTDNTLSIIEKYKDKISCIISEEDNGIYSAMNKGIKVSTGEILYFLNSDDILLHENVIEIAINNFKKNEVQILFGDTVILDRSTGFTSLKNYNLIDRFHFFVSGINHQGAFYKKEVFTKCGYYNENLKIASDYELFLKIFLKDKLPYKYIKDIGIAIYSLEGISSINSFSALQTLERKNAQKNYFTKIEIALYNNRICYRIVSIIRNIKIKFLKIFGKL